jgi:hypothetical protein
MNQTRDDAEALLFGCLIWIALSLVLGGASGFAFSATSRREDIVFRKVYLWFHSLHAAFVVVQLIKASLFLAYGIEKEVHLLDIALTIEQLGYALYFAMWGNVCVHWLNVLQQASNKVAAARWAWFVRIAIVHGLCSAVMAGGYAVDWITFHQIVKIVHILWWCPLVIFVAVVAVVSDRVLKKLKATGLCRIRFLWTAAIVFLVLEIVAEVLLLSIPRDARGKHAQNQDNEIVMFYWHEIVSVFIPSFSILCIMWSAPEVQVEDEMEIAQWAQFDTNVMA